MLNYITQQLCLQYKVFIRIYSLADPPQLHPMKTKPHVIVNTDFVENGNGNDTAPGHRDKAEHGTFCKNLLQAMWLKSFGGTKLSNTVYVR